MKNRLVKIVECVIFIGFLLLTLFFLSRLLERKESVYKYAAFFNQKEDFDILFMGSSHVTNGIFPMELWRDYGFVSYNFGGHGNKLPTTYWVLENALDYTSPKLIVIDCFDLDEDIKTSDNFSNVHTSMDTFPLTIKKIRAINDMLDDDTMKAYEEEGLTFGTEERTKLGLIWDYSVYHTRWSELTKEDFVHRASVEKGAESRIGITAPELFERVSEEDIISEETNGKKYLRKMIEDCKERGIQVLLIYLPFPAAENHQRSANTVRSIAEEYGVDYINFLDEEIVDLDIDGYDSFQHLNPSGAKKVTKFIGNYVQEKYDIPDQRNNAAYESWYDDYKEYDLYKQNLIKEQKSLDLYLMLLSDDDYESEICVYNENGLKDEYYDKLIINSGGIIKNASKGIRLRVLDTEDVVTPDVGISVTDINTGDIVDEAYFTLESVEDTGGSKIRTTGVYRVVGDK